MRYIKTMFAAAAVIALMMVSEGFTLEWSDGGPEMYPLQYPPATTTRSVEVTPKATPLHISGWSDGGPEMYALQYPLATETTTETTEGVTRESQLVIAGWSDGGPEMYPEQYPPEKAAMQSTFKVSSLIGKNVRNADREDMGSVNEVLVAENGRIKYVLLDQGGTLGRDLLGRGIGTKLYAVPWSAFAMQPSNRTLMLDIAREKLEMAPTLEKGEYAMLDNADFEGRVYGYYGVKERMRLPAMFLGGKQGTYPAGSFIGAKVNDAEGVELGKVQDFVADEEGIIKYVVVRHGGSWFGIGSELTPVPWNLASLETMDHTIKLDVAANRFLEAPIIMGNSWSRFDDAGWNKEISNFYGD